MDAAGGHVDVFVKSGNARGNRPMDAAGGHVDAFFTSGKARENENDGHHDATLVMLRKGLRRFPSIGLDDVSLLASRRDVGSLTSSGSVCAPRGLAFLPEGRRYTGLPLKMIETMQFPVMGSAAALVVLLVQCTTADSTG